MRGQHSSGLTALVALLCAACTPSVPAPPDGGEGLPAGAMAAIETHLAGISNGRLVCGAGNLAEAAHLTGYINDDDRPDFLLDTRALHCRANRDGPAVNYFCGSGICAFPLIVSDAERWRVVPMMAGNEARLVEHYRETRIEIREAARGIPGGAVAVREYAWRNGRLVRTGEWTEGVEARRTGG